MADLMDLVNRLAAETISYRRMALEAANAEADYKRARGKRLLVARAAGCSMAAADAEVEGDDECAALLTRRLTTAAVADSQREVLRSLREHIGAVRTEIVNHRTADELTARGWDGSA